MKRTTIYLDSETETMLKLESARRGQPMAEIIREAVAGYLQPKGAPPGAGQYRSGKKDTADRSESVLKETGFGGKRR
jgi:hypothetical protein